MEARRQGRELRERSDDWSNPNMLFRVGISLPDRQMKPVYFYTDNLHDAKYLLVTVELNSSP